MVWYFNFCAPTVPNDPIINLNRVVQTACLMGFLVLYICVHIYYKMCGPDPLQQKQLASSSGGSQNSTEKNSDDNSENRDDDKSISIVGGLQGVDQNSSYVTFTRRKQRNGNTTGNGDKKTKKIQFQVVENVTIDQVQAFFPIVFGHFAIGCAFTVMYSPYTEQSIGMFVYILLSLILVFLNAKRFTKTARFVWGLMCTINCFLLMSGLLEVGQANYNKIRNQCFAVNYKPLY